MKYVVEDTDTGKKVYANSREGAEKFFEDFCKLGNEIRLSIVLDDGTENWIKIYGGVCR
jgi:hypothetical protein